MLFISSFSPFQMLWRRGNPKSVTPILHSVWANFQTSRTNVRIPVLTLPLFNRLCKIWIQFHTLIKCCFNILVGFYKLSRLPYWQVIFGGRWRHLIGESELWERLGGVDIAFTPASFGQANTQVFVVLYTSLVHLIVKKKA